jgi:hypothetical protein
MHRCLFVVRSRIITFLKRDDDEMTARFTRIILGFSAVSLLAGCETTTPTRVTRFNLGQPIAPAAVAIVPRDPADTGGLAFSTTASAISAELARLGFTVAAPNDATTPLVAVVNLDQTTRPGPPRGPAFSVGIGGATFGRHTGFGGGVGVPIGGQRESYRDSSLLSVQLKRRADSTVIWEGRAATETDAGSPADSPAMLSPRLATALFKDFPGASGQTIMVK